MPAARAHVDYAEIVVTDASKAKAFYAAALGWTFTDWGPDYVAIHDGKREAGGMRVEAGPAPPLHVLYADNLDAVKAQVRAAGGEIVGPDHRFPGGRRFHFRDPSGNELAVWTRE